MFSAEKQTRNDLSFPGLKAMRYLGQRPSSQSTSHFTLTDLNKSYILYFTVLYKLTIFSGRLNAMVFRNLMLTFNFKKYILITGIIGMAMPVHASEWWNTATSAWSSIKENVLHRVEQATPSFVKNSYNKITQTVKKKVQERPFAAMGVAATIGIIVSAVWYNARNISRQNVPQNHAIDPRIEELTSQLSQAHDSQKEINQQLILAEKQYKYAATETGKLIQKNIECERKLENAEHEKQLALFEQREVFIKEKQGILEEGDRSQSMFTILQDLLKEVQEQDAVEREKMKNEMQLLRNALDQQMLATILVAKAAEKHLKEADEDIKKQNKLIEEGATREQRCLHEIIKIEENLALLEVEVEKRALL